ncbi:hypothetical protein RRG08_014859 [Elysia crispata]|uniref:Uncharacterized protein n=1 Tax=Elysia crispata TaxID=231223 RepID=A0AAE1AMP0_9GAST|nr:hypothetical protein RRG08_014859 [Elysia crispata]
MHRDPSSQKNLISGTPINMDATPLNMDWSKPPTTTRNRTSGRTISPSNKIPFFFLATFGCEREQVLHHTPLSSASFNTRNKALHGNMAALAAENCVPNNYIDLRARSPPPLFPYFVPSLGPPRCKQG